MAASYRCFFCEEVFKTRKTAWEHFGDGSPCGSDVPACVDPLRTDEKERMKELRMSRELALKGMRSEERADDAEYAVHQVYKELQRYFGKDCTTMWQAGDRYKNLEFELKLVREELEALKGVTVEAASG